MPETCFVSHSYSDSGHIPRLLDTLPRHVRPVVFPPIDVPPNERVSDELVRAVTACGGLVYLTSGHSDRSFWVRFERDYAIRCKMAVYAFEPDERRLTADHSPPLDLRAFPSFYHLDTQKVSAITSFMKRERHFDVWTDDSITAGIDFRARMEGAMTDRLANGGYAVAFISNASLHSARVKHELDLAFRSWPMQVLPVLLEPIADLWLPDEVLRLSPVRLYEEVDTGEINWNRVDDLIVRIYFLVSSASPPGTS